MNRKWIGNGLEMMKLNKRNEKRSLHLIKQGQKPIGAVKHRFWRLRDYRDFMRDQKRLRDNSCDQNRFDTRRDQCFIPCSEVSSEDQV